MDGFSIEERLDALNAILDELQEENHMVPIVVEGRHDIESLRALGLEGELLTINIGLSLLAFCEQYAQKHDAVILLMDWDPRGKRLRKTLKRKFRLVGVDVNDQYWLDLRRYAYPEIKDIESLAALLRRLSNKARHPS